MELWAVLSVAAAFLQNLRSAAQKSLTGRVGVAAATFARFVFALPWALALVAALVAGGVRAPGPTVGFALWALAGALAQIAATLLLLYLFRLRNFAVGNTFAKTETVQTAVLGAALLGDRVGALGWTAIGVSFAGVLLLSGQGGLRAQLASRATAIGLASGAAFALASIGYRGASLALAGEAGFLVRAAFTLAAVLAIQTVAMAAWMALRAPGSIRATFVEWRLGALAGAAGAAASLGWFSALTLQTAALVRAVGQVELIFNWLTARLAFGERPSLRETLGIVLVAGGILLLLAG
jgi:drug/metabolite transporter (DMT)-like permease